MKRITLLSIIALVVATPAAAVAEDGLAGRDRRALEEYAADTWASFEALVFEETGLAADNIGGDLSPDSRSRFTSPTNIGSYLWSALAARQLRIISSREARERVAATLETLSTLERHDPSGQFYNWYDPLTGDKLTVWPVDGSPVHPFLSSVDNGWLAAALLMVRNSVPALADEASALLEPMDFGYYYDPEARGPDFGAGLLRGGFWADPPPGCYVADNYRGDTPDVYYTCHHYGSFNTEPRIASYLGIAFGQIPPEHYFAGWRTFPATCDWGWQEQQPVGEFRTYLGLEVFEGAYTYRGLQLVPTWGGSMFEALMVPLLVPEEQWGPRSWGVNHPLYVEAQIEHGLEEAGYGYWGFSPSNNPDGGYREYGVDPIGLNPDGYSSDQERTTVDYGFPGCRDPQPEPAEYGRGVVTPHASFLALDFARAAAMDNLVGLRQEFGDGVYGPGGFYDAIDVTTGVASQRYLALDQGMILAAIGNELSGDVLQDYFVRGEIRAALRPLLRLETFTAGRLDQ